MDGIKKQIVKIVMLAFCLSSSVTLADSSEEMAQADDFYEKANMMDAAVIYKKLAFENYLPAQNRLGELLDYTEDHVQAVGWFILAGFQGNAEGAYNLGAAYLTGFGIKRDPDQAMYWIKFAADKDNLNAVKVLESAYRRGTASGLPVQVDLKQAEFWKEKKIPLVAAEKKRQAELVAAERKAREEKAAAIKISDEEAARKKLEGNSK